MSLVYQAEAVGAGRRPGLYLGGKVEAKDQSKLSQWQVSHILNVTPPKEANIQAGVPNYFESSGKFIYKRVPIFDSPTSVAEFSTVSDEIVSFIAAGLVRGGSVLVHCQKGVSRSTTCVLMYLMRRVGMHLADAMAMVKRRRPRAEPIPAFIEMLKDYEKQCQSLGILQAPAAERKKEGVGSERVVGPVLPRLDPSIEKVTKKPIVGPELPNRKMSNNLSTKMIPISESLDKDIGLDEGCKEGVKRRVVGPTMPDASESPAKRQKQCG